MKKQVPTHNKPPAPETLALTFAVSHLEDSPLSFLLITLEGDIQEDDGATVSIEMRVSNRANLELMTNKLRDSLDALDKPRTKVQKA